MRLSAFSKLLLVLCAAMITGHKASDRGLYSLETTRGAEQLGKYRIYGDAQQSNKHRQMRSLLWSWFQARFQQAWKSILKTTFSFKPVRIGNEEYKFYAKVGTSKDALADFQSLRPKRVQKIEGGLEGQAGNQDIMLEHYNEYSIMWLNNKAKKTTELHKIIVYAENRAKAMAAMNELPNML